MKKVLISTAIVCAYSVAGVASAQTTPAAATYGAGEIRGQLGVELTIGKGCEVIGGAASATGNSFGTMNFGEVPSLKNSVDAQTKALNAAVIQLNCTKDVSYKVALDDGRNAAGAGARRLALAGGTEYVPYNLYQDAARTQVWDQSNAVTKLGTGAADELIVYGRIPGLATTPAAGKYADTVMVTVSW